MNETFENILIILDKVNICSKDNFYFYNRSFTSVSSFYINSEELRLVHFSKSRWHRWWDELYWIWKFKESLIEKYFLKKIIKISYLYSRQPTLRYEKKIINICESLLNTNTSNKCNL